MTIPISQYVAGHQIGEFREQEVHAAASRRRLVNELSGRDPRRLRRERAMQLDRRFAFMLVTMGLLFIAVIVTIGGG